MLLMEQAVQLRGPGLRRKRLEAIATNREIITAWEQAPTQSLSLNPPDRRRHCRRRRLC